MKKTCVLLVIMMSIFHSFALFGMHIEEMSPAAKKHLKALLRDGNPAARVVYHEMRSSANDTLLLRDMSIAYHQGLQKEERRKKRSDSGIRRRLF